MNRLLINVAARITDAKYLARLASANHYRDEIPGGVVRAERERRGTCCAGVLADVLNQGNARCG